MPTTAAPIGVDSQCLIVLVEICIATGRSETTEGPWLQITPAQYPDISESRQRSLQYNHVPFFNVAAGRLQ